jgi:hypothetical protein
VLDVQALDERKRMAGLVVAAESNGDPSHRRWSVSSTRLVNSSRCAPNRVSAWVRKWVCSSIVVFACARRVLSLLTFAFSRTTLCNAQTCGASQHLPHFRNAMRHPMIRGKSLTVILNEIFKQRVAFALQYALAAIPTRPDPATADGVSTS